LDTVINNAGMGGARTPLVDFDMDVLTAVLNLNVVSPAAVTKAAIPHLRKTKGSLVFIASIIGGKKPAPGINKFIYY